MTVEDMVSKVRDELEKYEHPLFTFEARNGAVAESVDVVIRFEPARKDVHEYIFQLRSREIEHTQFPWTFQKHLYDCLHDYVIEMFTRNPQREN
jgi:hypothetical protein